MKQRVLKLAFVLAVAGALSTACGSDDDSTPSKGGAGGAAGASGSGGKGGTAGAGGKAGASSAGKGGGDSAGGAGAGGEGGAPLGESGSENGGESGAGEGGSAGAVETYTAEQVGRGQYLVKSVALCGGCHTATNGAELGGNPAFKNSTLPAPNLTPDATGLGEWSAAEIINAIRNGVDDEGRHLDAAMPYWLFHNLTDPDALSIVAYLRSLPKAVGEVGAANPNATPVTPLAPSAFPNSSLAVSDANYAAAQKGKYLLSSAAQCVKCHSPASAGLPVADFFSGVAPTSATQIFSSNITPDATGISGWTAADVATALKVGTNKAGTVLCGSMPSAAKGYGGLTTDDATAIGVYLTTIAAVSKAAAAPTLEPPCQ
jgi:Cytochrome C oxidase, cbb3-type, subunit III